MNVWRIMITKLLGIEEIVITICDIVSLLMMVTKAQCGNTS